MPFVPTDLASLIGWWKPPTSGSDGDAIASVADSSSGGNAMAQSVAIRKPILKTGGNGIGGQNALQYTAANTTCLTSSLVATTKPTTLIAVVNVTDTAALKCILGTSANNGQIWYADTAEKMVFGKLGAATIHTSTNTPSTGTPHVLALTYGSAGATAQFTDGVANGTATSNQTFSAGTFGIGMWTTFTAPFAGLMGDVLVFNSDLSTNDRNKVEWYLADKYGIAITGIPRECAGTSAGTSTASATITVGTPGGACSGTSAGSSTASATLTAGAVLVGTSAGSSTAVAALTVRAAPVYADEYVFGHSIANRAGASDAAHAWDNLLKPGIGNPTITNVAMNGAQISHFTGGLADNDDVWWLFANYTNDNSSPYVSRTGIHAIFHGLNDIKYPVSIPQAGVLLDFKAYISRLRCAFIEEDSSGSITYGANWSQTGDSTDSSGTTYHGTSNAAAGNITRTLPADFPGGNLVFGFRSQDEAASSPGRGGVFDIYVDGVLQTTHDSRGAGNATGGGLIRHSVARVNNVSAAMASKVWTIDLTAMTTSAIFDWWGWEQADAPLVVVFKQPRLPAGGYAAAGGSNPPLFTAADIDNWNTGLDTLAADFPSGVITVDLSLMNADTSYFAVDLVHPNDTGHAYIASQAEKAIRAVQPLVGSANPLASVVAGSSTASGVLSVSKPLTATVAGVGTASGQIIQTQAVVGTSAGSATASGVLAQTNAATGTSDGAATAVAALAQIQPIAAISAGTSTASGDLSVTKPLAASSAGSSTAAADLVQTQPLEGTSAGSSTATGVIGVAGEYAGFTHGTSDAAGSLSVGREIAGTSAGGSTATADITVRLNLAAASAGASTVSASLSQTNALAANTAGGSTAAGALSNVSQPAGTSAGTSTATGTLTVGLYLAGTTDGLSTVTASLTTGLFVAGSVSGNSTASGSLSVTIPGVAPPIGHGEAEAVAISTVEGNALVTN